MNPLEHKNSEDAKSAKTRGEFFRLPLNLSLHQRDAKGRLAHINLGNRLMKPIVERNGISPTTQDQIAELVGLMGTITQISGKSIELTCVCGQLFTLSLESFSRYTIAEKAKPIK